MHLSSNGLFQSQHIQSVSVWLRAVSVALLGMGQMALLISLPVLVEYSGLGYGVFAGLVALGTFLFIIAAPAWGRFSDRFGRKPVVLAGLCGILLSNVIMVMTIEGVVSTLINESLAIALLIVSRIIYGLMVAGLYPAVQAWALSDSGNETAVNELGRITAFISIGRLLGPVLPLIFLPLGATAPLLVLASLAGLLLVLLSFAAEPFQRSTKAVEQSNLKGILLNSWTVMFLAVAVTALFGLLQYLIAPILQQRFAFSASSASEVLSLLMMLAAVSTLVSHITLLKYLRRNVATALKAGSVLIMTGCLCLVTAEQMYLLAFGIILCAAAVTLLTPVYTSVAAQKMPDNQGEVTGALSMVHTIGYTLGALFAGLTGMSDSPMMIIVSLVIAFLILITAFFLIDPEKEKTKKKQ